jgi:hypothetical protein
MNNSLQHESDLTTDIVGACEEFKIAALRSAAD